MDTQQLHRQAGSDPVRILVINDDPNTIDAIQLTMQVGWPEAQLIKAETGREGINLIGSECPKVIVLDLGLPKINGYEVLKEIRRFSSLPILVLAPDDEEKAIVKIFTWGANACLVKPFRHMEFLARIKALSGNRLIILPERPSSQVKAGANNKDHRNGHDYNKTIETFERDKHIVGQCPKCASILVYQEGFFICPVCGFTR